MIIDEVEDRKRTYASIARQFIELKLPFDLFVLSHDEYIGHKDRRYSFVREMATAGVVVYEKGRIPQMRFVSDISY